MPIDVRNARNCKRPPVLSLTRCNLRGVIHHRQVETETVDETVVNRDALPHSGEKVLQRGRERLSLTVRRVLRTKNVLGLRK